MISLSYDCGALKSLMSVVIATSRSWHCIQVLVNHVLVRYSKIATGKWNISPCSPASKQNASMLACSKCPVISCPCFPYCANIVTWLISCLVKRLGIARPCCLTGPCATTLGKFRLIPIAGNAWFRAGFKIL